ncbi:MAG TPA: hypothetical protein VKY26_08145, partial [Actinomycetota bacterium]|nr:hypothetical protein [Actinomycetota bacterium]
MTESWILPAMLMNGTVFLAGPTYQLLKFPLPLDNMGFGHRTEAEGNEYVRWAAETEPRRVPAFLEFLVSAGLPVAGLPAATSDVERLNDWIAAWFPHVVAPWRGFTWVYGRDSYMEFFDRHADEAVRVRTLELSLALDLGFLIVAAARTLRPDLRWTLHQEVIPGRPRHGQGPLRYFSPSMSPTALPDDLFTEPRRLLAAAAREGGYDPAPWERLHGKELVLLYEQLLAPAPPPPPPPPPEFQATQRGYPAKLLTRREFRLRQPGPRTTAPDPAV